VDIARPAFRVTASDTMQRISRQHTFPGFDRSTPAIAQVEPGETFVMETVPSSLVATGPIHVRGAEPGDALAITIREISFGSEAAMWMKPGRGVFGARLADSMRQQVIRPIPLRDGKAIFSEQIAIPLRPMIGVAGVAPWGDAALTYWPGRHGGNLDCRLLATGATLYLPVAAPGALLGIGDLHAAMGDGEIMLSGVEAAGEVTLSVQVVRPWPWTGPWIETPSELVALGSARSTDQALEIALTQMIAVLQARATLTFEEAGMLCSAAADATICQVVNPQVTVRVALPKGLVPGLTLY
jgi:amidase